MRALLVLLALLAGAAPLGAEALATAGDIAVTDGEARSAGPLARTGAGYLTLTNAGGVDDRLVAAESPAAERVELHETTVVDGVARMTPREGGLAVPAGESVALSQGGLHLMFLGLTDAWDAEAGIPVTLRFERAGALAVVLPVAAAPATSGHDAHQGH